MPRAGTFRINWLPLVIHLLVTIAVIVVGAALIPQWYLKTQLNKLTSASLADRERGLNYVIQLAKQDHRVLRGAIDRLDVQDPENFLQIVLALDRAGAWDRPTIPAQPWLRWLGLLGQEPNPDSRINAVQLAAQLNDLADHPQLLAMLQAWLADPDAPVRHAALIAAARLTGTASKPRPYIDLIAAAGSDPSPETARAAWIMLGLLKAADTLPDGWRNQPPAVAEAVLWAIVQSHPDQPAPTIQIIDDPTAHPTLRAMAAYCLHLQISDDAKNRLTQLATIDQPPTTAEQQLVTWRSILGSPPEHHTQVALSDTSLINRLRQPASQPLLLAALHRGWAKDPQEWLDAFTKTDNPADRDQLTLETLALLEGLPVNEHQIAVPPQAPDMLRLAAVAATRDPRPEDLMPLFASDTPALRDLACVVAADRFSDQQMTDLIERLLNDFNDNTKQSGAILAGITGAGTDLLIKKTRDEDVWPVLQIMRLSLWMQGKLPEMGKTAPGLLSREDLPTTSILLAMLHRGHPDAWDCLLDPWTQQPIDLVDLLDQHRWWRVLQRYLPEPDRQRLLFWPWADPELEQFQIDVLKNWYALNRHRL